MPTYRLTLSCGHSRTLESDTTPTAKNPSCPDCPPDPKYGKVQRPVVLVEVADLDSSGGGVWTQVERADLPTTPRGPRVPSVPTSQLVAAVKEAIEYVSQARWATGAPLLETPVLDSIAALWAPAEEAPSSPDEEIAPVDLTGVATVGDLLSKLSDKADEVERKRNGGRKVSEAVMAQLAEVGKAHAEVDTMSRRECLAYLSGREYTGISRKPVGELREMVLADRGVAV